MSFSSYIAFVLASLVVVLIPGPTVMLVVSQALSSGKRSVFPLAAGVGLGDLIAMTLSFVGLGAVLATSAFLFALLKWAGAAYLVYLGIQMFRAASSIDAETTPQKESPGAQFLSAFVTTALNPKSILFFVAFVPQFMSNNAPLTPQFILLGVTYLILGMLNASFYAIFASRLRELLRSARAVRNFNRGGGCVLVSAGVLAATVTRP